MDRQLVPSGSPYEREIGFSRAVRVGPYVSIAGTAPVLPDGSTPKGVYAQTRRCLEIMLTALRAASGEAKHVVRTRVMLTPDADWQEAARAHGEIFADIRPACTFVRVAGFIDPAWLVELEADAIV